MKYIVKVNKAVQIDQNKFVAEIVGEEIPKLYVSYSPTDYVADWYGPTLNTSSDYVESLLNNRDLIEAINEAISSFSRGY